MTKAGEKLIEAARQAVRSAQCDHAMVVESSHDDGSPKTTFCPRCECSFHVTPDGCVHGQGTKP